MENYKINKVVNNAIRKTINNKYKVEHLCFTLAVIGIIIIEFMPMLYCPSIWDNATSAKIYNIILQLCLAYVASYIFFYLNIYKKEKIKYKKYYPQIFFILKDMFFVFELREKYYKSISKENDFIYNRNTIEQIIKQLECCDKLFTNVNESCNTTIALSSDFITEHNYFTSMRIFYDIEMLNTFDEVFSDDFKALLFKISTNNFIIKNKDKIINNLDYYRTLIDSEITLYNDIKDLKKYSKSMFGIEF